MWKDLLCSVRPALPGESLLASKPCGHLRLGLRLVGNAALRNRNNWPAFLLFETWQAGFMPIHTEPHTHHNPLDSRFLCEKVELLVDCNNTWYSVLPSTGQRHDGFRSSYGNRKSSYPSIGMSWNIRLLFLHWEALCALHESVNMTRRFYTSSWCWISQSLILRCQDCTSSSLPGVGTYLRTHH